MIAAILFLAALGAVLIGCGIMGMNASIPWYHYPKVAEENKAIFEKLMSTAQIIGGTGILIFCLLTFFAILTVNPILMKIGMCLMMAMLAAAICFFTYAMTKYNK